MDYKEFMDEEQKTNGTESAESSDARQTERPRVYGQVGGVSGAGSVGDVGNAGGIGGAGGAGNTPNPYYRGNPAPPAYTHPGGPAPFGTRPQGGTAGQGAPFIPPPQRPAAAAAGAGEGSAKAPLVDRGRFGLLIAIIIVAMIASGVAGGFIGANLTGKGGTPVTASGSNVTIKPSSDANISEAVAQKVLDSVVGITTTVTTQGDNYFGFNMGSQESGGVGTGIIVDARGYILTNSHVVLDGTLDKIEVLLSDGSTVAGKLLWNDSSIDLAIVKVDATGKTFKPAELGDSDNAKIGQYVAAIGNPLGLDFNGSMTQGIISGLGRSITASDGNRATTMEGLIQVDAAINSGNSGGPLLDKEGKVIGVNTAKAQAEGMGFAIPINTAKPIIEKVIKTGSFERVYMGVSAADAGTIAEQYPNLKIASGTKGAFITAVSGSSPADEAGLKMKDIITKVDDKAITSSTDLIKTLLNYSAGDAVKVTYIRDGKTATANVKLATQADVYGEWNQNGSGSSGSEGSGDGSQTPSDPYGGQAPTDPFENPFGDW
ncbi:MAG: S1C family serine protease [Clostridiales Family XIII bacterium]|jgi:S1-C subfamily serine protease|nr:S1C family serine protease [Clostridiales Family XIII bacterium]